VSLIDRPQQAVRATEQCISRRREVFFVAGAAIVSPIKRSARAGRGTGNAQTVSEKKKGRRLVIDRRPFASFVHAIAKNSQGGQ
jgi:hypothetical protein